MKSNYKRLGDYIQLVDVRNKDMAVTRLLGININKQFMPSVANVSSTDLSRYKVINKGVFACNVMHVGRDEKIPIAFYTDDEPAIISPAYLMFEITNVKLLPEFLMTLLQRPEFDRYAWYICDSSIRGGLDWKRFCDIQIPIPDIEVQRLYATLYKTLQKNQQAYKKSLDDLQLICSTYIEGLKKDSSILKKLGPYIKQISERNENNNHYPVLGVSNSRTFVETKANTSGLNLGNYKIVRDGNFVYNPSRLNIGSIALRSESGCIVSPMYVVFEIVKKTELLPEYLFLWFNRQPFSDYVWFYAFGSVRDTFDFGLMKEVYLPIPSIEVQESIVAIHHTLETRKRLYNELKTQIQNLCPILMRGVVENMV